MEVAKRVLADAPTPTNLSTSIIQSAPHGATTYFISLCGLSVCLGAMMYRVFSLLQQMMELQRQGGRALQVGTGGLAAPAAPTCTMYVKAHS